MRLRILGNMGGVCEGAFTMSSLINDDILLDAGTGVQNLPLKQILKLNHVLLTHSHLDHTAMLPFLTDMHGGKEDSLWVHCTQETADAVRNGLLNNTIWPNMEAIKVAGKPILSFNVLTPYQRAEVGGVSVTPLPVRHTVPTVGYCLHGERENFVFISDITGAEPAFWQYLKELTNFRRMVMEISFPNEMEKMAKLSGHLTPAMMEKLLSHIDPSVQIHYCHAKPIFAEKIAAQVADRFGGRVTPLESRQVFDL